MDIDNTQDAAEPPPASAGSHGEPVAWFIHADGWEMVSLFREHADAAAEENDADVSPLYLRPQPTLTNEERVDVAMWLSECLRQCSLATDGGSEEVAERWRNRSERAARMLERLR